MRIKQFVIMMMIICGCVSVGCKNKEAEFIVDQDSKKPVVVKPVDNVFGRF